MDGGGIADTGRLAPGRIVLDSMIGTPALVLNARGLGRIGSRLGESNPGPTHYERVTHTMVAGGWCRLTLGYARPSWAVDGR
jgi:hypothetical protein